MIEVEAPDGTIVEFPPETPPEAMTRAMQQRFGGGQASAAPVQTSNPPMPAGADIGQAPVPQERTWGQAAAGVAAHGLRGARRGVATIAGLPVDIVNAVMGMAGAPVSQTPVGGSKFFDQALGLPAQAAATGLNAAGVPANAEIAPPANAVERVAGRIGEELGAAVLPAGAALRAGGAGVRAAREGGALSRQFVEPAAVALETGRVAQFAGREAAAATAAGLGAGVVNEATGASTAPQRTAAQNLGDFGGAVSGVGALGLARAIGAPAMNVVGALTGNAKMADRVVRDDVTDQIIRAAGMAAPDGRPVDASPLIDAIMNGRRADAVIPGFRDTLGDRTGNAGVQALEFGRSGGPNSGQFAQRIGDNTAATDAAFGRVEPTTPPGALRSELLVERDRRLTDAGVQTQNAQDAFDAAGQRVMPQMTGEARGADIRAGLADAEARARAQVDEAYRPINESTEQVDIRPLAERFNQTREGLSLAERQAMEPRAAGVPQQLLPEDAAAQASVPLREVTGLRSSLTDDTRAAGAAGRRNEARIGGQFVDQVDQFMQDAIPAPLREQFDAARASRRNLADRFERPGDAIADVLRTREGGDYRTPDSAVARRFVQDDSQRISDFQALMRESGDNPRVVSAVRDQILADVRDRNLLANPSQLDAYLGRYTTILSDKRFANVRSELTSAAGLRRALDDATARETGLARDLGTPQNERGTSTVGQYLRFGDERSADAMRTVMSSRDPAKAADELLSFVNNDPRAADGARRAFWDIMQSRARRNGEGTQSASGTQPWMPRALKGFLEDPANAAVADRLWRDNPEHLQNIRQIAETLQQTDTRQRGKAIGTSGTAQVQQSILPSAETLGSLALAERRGQIGLPFIGLRVASVIARRATSRQQAAAFQQALDKALLDPDWAALLLKENNPANRAALARSAKSWMGNEAGTLIEILNDRDETTDAAMRGAR